MQVPSQNQGSNQEVHRNVHEPEVSHYALYGTETVQPLSMTEALESPDADMGKAAAQEEYDALMQHDTWSLVPLPPRCSTIGSKWVFKVKCNAQVEVDRYKCPLVAQGFGQKPELDYTETFALVAKFATIHTLIAFVAQRKMHIHQMDVKTMFLNGELEEDTFMKQPEGFVQRGDEELVCHLRKSVWTQAEPSGSECQAAD